MNNRTVFTRIGVTLLACCALIVSARSQAGDRDSGQRRAASSGVIIPQQPAGAPLLGLTEDQLERFFVGQEQFNRVFEVEEGLGPIFNQRSCGLCHNNPVGGPGSITVTRAGLAGDKGGFDPLEELGGTLFQQEAISEDCAEVVPEEANVVAFRVTNGMMGYGLVEAIPDADIQYWADYPPSGEVSGKANIVSAAEDDLDHVGRFGWKADVPTMITFSAGASMNEMGITNPLNPEDNDPNGINPPELADCDTVADPEIGMEFIEQLADFQRFLTAAPQTPKSGMTGEEIFVNIGCADCHIAAFMTPDDPELEDAIRNKEIRQYTDYLLHDIGLAADFIQEPAQPPQNAPDVRKQEEFTDPEPADAEEQVGPPYTVPGPRFRQLAVLAVGVAAFGISDGTGSGKEAAESQISGSSISVVGRPGLSAPPPRVNSAIVGRPGLQQGFAAGLGPARDRNIFTVRMNALSGPNGRCQDLVNAGFFSGSRAGCETHFRP